MSLNFGTSGCAGSMALSNIVSGLINIHIIFMHNMPNNMDFQNMKYIGKCHENKFEPRVGGWVNK